MPLRVPAHNEFIMHSSSIPVRKNPHRTSRPLSAHSSNEVDNRDNQVTSNPAFPSSILQVDTSPSQELVIQDPSDIPLTQGQYQQEDFFAMSAMSRIFTSRCNVEKVQQVGFLRLVAT